MTNTAHGTSLELGPSSNTIYEWLYLHNTAAVDLYEVLSSSINMYLKFMSFSKAGLKMFQTTLRLRYLITIGQTGWTRRTSPIHNFAIGFSKLMYKEPQQINKM